MGQGCGSVVEHLPRVRFWFCPWHAENGHLVGWGWGVPLELYVPV